MVQKSGFNQLIGSVFPAGHPSWCYVFCFIRKDVNDCCWWQPEIRRSPGDWIGKYPHSLQGFVHPDGGYSGFFWTIKNISMCHSCHGGKSRKIQGVWSSLTSRIGILLMTKKKQNLTKKATSELRKEPSDTFHGKSWLVHRDPYFMVYYYPWYNSTQAG